MGALIVVSLFSQQAFAAFLDVTASNPYQDSINYLQSTGVVNGYNNEGVYYGPEDEITRAAFTKIVLMSKYSEAEIEACDTSSHTFNDVNDADWFAKYVCKAKELGLVNGYADGSFKPNNNINFVEAAKIVVVNFDGEKTSDPWYKSYVETLANDKAIPVEIVSFDTLINRGQMAEIIVRLLQNDTSKASLSYAILSGESTIDVDFDDDVLSELDEIFDDLELDMDDDDFNDLEGLL